MTQKFTAEEVRKEADFLSTYSRKTSRMLAAYADTLSQPADSGRVDDAMVDRAFRAMDTVFADAQPRLDRRLTEEDKSLALKGIRAALEAALAAQGQGEAVAWGVFAVGDECDGKLIEHAKTQAEADAIVRNWPVNDNAVLRVAPIYAAPTASPAGVPDGWALVPEICTDSMFLAGDCQIEMGAGLRGAWERMVANAPSAPEGDGGATDPTGGLGLARFQAQFDDGDDE